MSEQTKARCAYCHSERPVSEMKQGKIIFQDYNYVTRKKFVNSKFNAYCNDKPCHSNDQMAHEG
ncbi:hypothetical protein LOZ80_37960 [Paenibacillus sp. HWE-109]|uniref:hypothetical protein n=1 Tax=Paenibacillus sp. HWE-109 TaxID=1306526 RepID=UPI001EDE8309|nr:hypothetical protein [Paenibacillus sp. HWE-109]UKS27178.1 hypothetical protein LOZ80_37960 [Paenibacillus sp. HWE-109]